jgi:predicted unusual protein kinase regulating ubiquinone biosynthesis (AarF/ABC1/UbiB family)
MTNFLPRGARFDQVFDEIRAMFHQEVDYHKERSFHEKFRDLLAGDPRYVVPEVIEEFSTQRILSTDLASGWRIDHPQIQNLSQERRNRLGQNFLQLYLRELLEFRLMQTDPHFGNYLINEKDQLVLLDFGAVRAVPDSLRYCYLLMLEGALNRDRVLIEQGGRRLGLLQPGDPPDLVNDYVEICFLITEPFQGPYDWGASDLPKRVLKAGSKIVLTHKLRAPPRELVFLDRKLGGVFVFLSTLGFNMDARDLTFKILRSARPSSNRE